ncbi:protein SICKLE [Primulina huaijiensis]|uniref:protein SICKLE n=1 Tax=Primulina huaijiensis TaxID=1492673 RepID=UPI003CC7799A
MEESEKRRERLKAMRMEAAKADISIDSESSGILSHSLSNPLNENEPAPSTAVQYSRPRFDYYTDPMSAFSADKRRNNFSHQVSQGYSSMPPNMTSSPQAPGNIHSQSSSLGTPMGVAGPLGKPQGYTSNTWGGSYSSLNYNYPPNMRDVNLPNPSVGRGDTPHAVHGWGRGGIHSSSPRPQFLSHHDSPNMLDVNFPNSGAGWGDSPNAVHGWGRGVRYSNSPRPQLHSHHDSRRGIGHYSDWGRGRGVGPSARRGKDSKDPVSAELRPDLYYNKEMLEDPWKGMTPVIWKGPNSDGSWLPKSISVKKARPSPEASQKSVSQPSLAEYLATLNDTVNEPTHEEHEQSEVRES